MGLEMTTGMTRMDKVKGLSRGPVFLKKRLKAFIDGEGEKSGKKERKTQEWGWQCLKSKGSGKN